MSTRLDRLFSLLESGSNAGTRRAAAVQLGEVQRLHPHELKPLLNRLLLLLRNPSWDTRVAAGQAVAAVAENVPPWSPSASLKSDPMESEKMLSGKMQFADFDINNVIKHGAQLLGSEGREYDFEEEDRSDLGMKRAVLNEHMGFGDLADKTGLVNLAREMIHDDDLRIIPPSSSRSTFEGMSLTSMWSAAGQSMSARERNRYKRKLKSSMSRSISMDDNTDQEVEPSGKKPRNSASPQDNISTDECKNGDIDLSPEETGEWPFSRILEELCGDLFHCDWRIRHGAATGVREIIRVHGQGAGKFSGLTADEMVLVNDRWLEDVALRLLCVLALDRFGDFVSYEVVAPVRESCAQALGAVIKWMSPPLIDDAIECLLKLMQQSNWQARHGGLLGIKYVLVVKQNLVSELFPKVYPALVGSLKDPVDDVCAVSAAALEAVMDEFLIVMPQEVPNVLALLWDGLLEFDDLTSWTNNFMSLLSTIISKSSSAEMYSTQKPLSELLPRLWPFLEHSSEKIRASVLQTVNTLVSTVAVPFTESSQGASLLEDLLKRLFQRAVLEERPVVHSYIRELWKSCLHRIPYQRSMDMFQERVTVWICLAMQPACIPIDPSAFGISPCNTVASIIPSDKLLYFAGSDTTPDNHGDRDVAVTRSRVLTSELISGLIAHAFLMDKSDEFLTGHLINAVLLFHLKSKSAIQKITISLVIFGLAREAKMMPRMKTVLTEQIRDLLAGYLEETVPYDELAGSVTQMQNACLGIVQELQGAGAALDPLYLRPILTLEQCKDLVSSEVEKAMAGLGRKINKIAMIQKRNEATVATHLAASEYLSMSTRVRLHASMALVALDYCPEKLAPLVRPLMDTLKRDANKILQDFAASSLSQLMLRVCDNSHSTCDKIVKNLCSYLCCDPSVTPKADDPLFGLLNGNPSSDEDCDTITKTNGIMSLVTTTKDKERNAGVRGPGTTRKLSTATTPVSCGIPAVNAEETSVEIQRRGGEYGLSAISRTFGPDITAKLPQLVDDRVLIPFRVHLPLSEMRSCGTAPMEKMQDLISSLHILDRIVGHLHPDTHELVLGLLPHIAMGICHELTAVRHMTARLLASMAVVQEDPVMRFVVENVLEILSAVDSEVKRQGAIEVVGCILDRLGMRIVPYIVMLTVPVMRRMTDQDQSVRLMASQCFGALVRLMPLGMSANKKPGPSWFMQKPDEMRFLEQLLDSTKMEQFVLPVPVDAQLRSYQQDGLNWLSFLNRYNLHGILCDDMGLGKTLQTICILASDHHERTAKFEESKSPSWSPLPSLVICPSTLIGHWAREVARFVTKDHLNPMQYEGSPGERFKLRRRVKQFSLVISSYEILKNDVDFFKDVSWNYCVLDEGHVIRNNKTRVFKAIKQLVCNHRLILSGTPVQNNVQDLWALFDFLMPGLLGTEKRFTARFARPIDSSKDPKASSKDIEEGALAMETLHKQVLPFILRRLKSDVLKDLPPKIVQDYYCDLSPLQLRLYEDFAKSKAQKDVIHSIINVNGSSVVNTSSHVFQAFQYLRKVCNHPALVLNEKHPQYKEVTRELERSSSSMYDIQHAAKFVALQQLLLDCGIGVEDSEQSVVNSHRALIFCQLTAVLEMLEQHLFRTHMPTVTYLKLDGSVPVRDRQNVVERFNSDPSIDVLLLTTSIGGLGLNLTGADTVIFVEHDWNPSKDIQAMDRAHRIGQKRVVNVYRLITRGTLEEKIMGLQKFKLHVANSIITQENSALQTMGTEQIVDLFSVESAGSARSGSGNVGGSVSSDVVAKKIPSKVPAKGLKAALDNLEDLWDSSQYDTEFDVNRFLESLNK